VLTLARVILKIMLSTMIEILGHTDFAARAASLDRFVYLIGGARVPRGSSITGRTDALRSRLG
jgi:hypothetical protein